MNKVYGSQLAHPIIALRTQNSIIIEFGSGEDSKGIYHFREVYTGLPSDEWLHELLKTGESLSFKDRITTQFKFKDEFYRLNLEDQLNIRAFETELSILPVTKVNGSKVFLKGDDVYQFIAAMNRFIAKETVEYYQRFNLLEDYFIDNEEIKVRSKE